MSRRNLCATAAALLLTVLAAAPAAALPAVTPPAAQAAGPWELLRGAWAAFLEATVAALGDEGGSLDPNGGKAAPGSGLGEEGGSLDPNG